METNIHTINEQEIRDGTYPAIGSVSRGVHARIDALVPLSEVAPPKSRRVPMLVGTMILLVVPLALMQWSMAGNVQIDGGAFCPAPESTHAAAPEQESSTSHPAPLPLGEGVFSSASSLPVRSSEAEAGEASESSFTSTPHPDNHVAVYLTAASVARDDFFQSTMEYSGKAGANAIVFDVKSDRVLFDSDAQMARQLGLVSARFDLQPMLAIARQRGLYTIARFVSVGDAGLTAAKPEVQLKDPKTGKVLTPGYIDPANPEALQYNSEIICDLAKKGVSEINLDYIRFATFNNPATNVYSAEEKADKVEAFVRMARETIDRCGPETKLGISTFAILGWNYPVNVAVLGQDFVRFAPLVDIISPMAYPAMFSQDAYYDPAHATHTRMYTLVNKTMLGYQELLGPKDSLKLRPWLQAYGVTTKNMQDQIQGALDAGGCGYMFWNANNAYGPVYKALNSIPMPARCL